MSNFNSDGSQDNEWDERGELAWNEFDWERYLREQDETVRRYLNFYTSTSPTGTADRIDAVAEKMGWGMDNWSDEIADLSDDDDDDDDEEDSSELSDEDDVYTLHKNPIFIATKAIYLGLHESWEALATDSTRVPQDLAVALLGSLRRGEEQAVQAINALDFGDYAMAVSLLKRAMGVLNGTLSLLHRDAVSTHPAVAAWRETAQQSVFDLREIWLRVMAECRDELDRPAEDES